MELDRVLALRSTCRAYSDQSVTEEELKALILAAQNAPIAWGDEHTSELIVVREGKLLEEIRQAVMLFSKRQNKHTDPFYGAKCIIFFTATDVSEDHIEYSNAGCMLENMILKATDLGLGSTYIWGCLRKLRNNPDIMKKLCLSDGYEILSALCIGHTREEAVSRTVTDKIKVRYL